MENKKKILIIEDEHPMAHALELKLKKEGFDAKTAPNGEIGLEMLENGNFDLALLDLVMPEKDGFYVLEKAREKGLSTKIIVASNLSQDEDKERAENMGAVDYFVKSNTPILEIVEKVKKALNI